MTPCGATAGVRTRTGTRPPDTLTLVSCTSAISGPGPASPRIAATTPRASWGVISFSGRSLLAISCSSSAAVASSSGTGVSPRVLARGGGSGQGRGGQGESFVAVGCYLLTRVPVAADAADVRQEEPGLAGNVGAHVPGRGLGVEGVAGALLHVVGPVGRGRLRGLDHVGALLAQVGQAVAHPLP